MQDFLEGLTATHDAKFFHDEAERLDNPLRSGFRGSPLNEGTALEAVHPLIRTNRPSPTCQHFINVADLQNSCNWLEERIRQSRFHS